MTTPGEQLDQNTDRIAALATEIAENRQRIDALEAGNGPVDPPIDPPIDPIPPDPPIVTDGIVPGDGWNGPTKPAPATGPYMPMARWDVVPEQAISSGFRVGVCAHHLNGIERVDIAADGGRWISVKRPSVNPRTNCIEYHAPLDLSSFLGGTITLRAVAYGHNGTPRVLEDLKLFVGEHVGKIIELGEGEFRIRDYEQSLPDRGWLVLRGAGRDKTKLLGPSRWSPGGRLKVEGATWTPGWGKGMCAAPSGDNDWVWLDDVEVIGTIAGDNYTEWTTKGWSRSHFTNCKISNVGVVFQEAGDQLLARNVQISDIHEDVFRRMGLAVNITIDDVNRGVVKGAHADLFVFHSGYGSRNVIFQDVKARNAKAQGMYGGNVDGVAMIRCDVETRALGAMKLGHTTNGTGNPNIKNLLIEDSRFVGDVASYFKKDAKYEAVMLRNSEFGQPDQNGLPWGWQQDGITVEPSPTPQMEE